MKRRKLKNVAASVRQRLLNEARATDRPFNELLQYFAMERFLFRLSQSPHAEKFHTMVRRGLLNSRMRDFFDVWILSRQFDFEGGVLAAAVRETFARRGVEVDPRPVGLTDEFAADAAKAAQWRGFLRKSRLDGASADLAVVVVAIAVFLRPVAEALHEGRAFTGRWQAPGPWSPA